MCRDFELKVRNPDLTNIRQRLGIVGNDIRACPRYFLDDALMDRPAFSVEDFRPAERWQPRCAAFLLLPSKHD
jgi:hypothetical protein